MKISKSLSFYILIIIGLILSTYRLSNIGENEISWDVLGYYLPLPATFVHDDPLLTKTDWVEKAIEEKDLSNSMYMVSTNDEGQPMYFFFLGMSLFYLPFFLFAHLFSSLFGFQMDGFSPPYQVALVIGGIIYTLIGLIYFRKILKQFFSERLTTIIILIIVFSTNYIHHLTLKNLETVNILFMLMTLIIWNTIKWHETYKRKNLIAIAVSITLMGMVKPSEILVILIPLLWNVTSIKSLKEKFTLIKQYKNQFIIAIGLSFIIFSPQMLYWIIKTGKPIYDSYKNPGVGLDFFNPHIIEVLFSYRKGWFLYTPVIIFALIGFYFFYKEEKKIFFPLGIYFLATFYLISSWSEWWYGASFSGRPFITSYPILGICLGFFLKNIWNKKLIIRISIVTLILIFTALNQFQWWQLKNYIFDSYRTTKELYWAAFLKTERPANYNELLLVDHNLRENSELRNPKKYSSFVLQKLEFEKNFWHEKLKGDLKEKGINNKTLGVTTNTNTNIFFKIPQEEEYALVSKIMFKDLTSYYYCWIEVSFDIRYPDNFQDNWPCMVISMDRKEGNYQYYAPEIKTDTIDNKWHRFTFQYLTPEIRNKKDKLLTFVWKRGKTSFDIDNFEIKVYSPIEK